MKSPIHVTEPTEREIQHAAYFLWEEAGRPEGHDLEIWFAAREILKHRVPATGHRLRSPALEPLSRHTVDAIAAD